MVLFRQEITARYVDDIWPVIFPAAALIALLGAWMMVRRDRPFQAFLCSSAMIGLLLVSGAIGMFPNLIISTLDQANNLTVYNAASADNTLQVCLIIALIGMPFVLLYTPAVYFIFRGKTVVDHHGY
jgi:cytochrome d ubiquinol oxidase subunit II